MKHFFKDKFFYIITVIALLVTIVPSVLYSMGLTFVFRDAVNMLLTPMQKGFNYASEAVDGFVSYFYKFDDLVEENNRLKEEIRDLREQNYDAADLEEMYTWMSDFLELKMQHQDYKMTAAAITGRESGNYAKILTIDAGSAAGLELAMPVVTSDGIVGQITELGLTWARVTTIVEPNSSVGAYIERTGDAGVCEGSFELSADGLCELNYLPADSTVQAGDRVLSTGFGSVYPRGLVIGYVESVEENPYTRGLTVKVKCAAELSELSRVMVITSFEATAVDASELAE
ncbi:MAG: rod shape-determining protein MreC [Clostridia bacterium]|nr:rod shape-determining protein MreC [Clostridia bacterium]